jgi:hypothetical protein
MYFLGIMLQTLLNLGAIISFFGLVTLAWVIILIIPDLFILLFGKNKD